MNNESLQKYLSIAFLFVVTSTITSAATKPSPYKLFNGNNLTQRRLLKKAIDSGDTSFFKEYNALDLSNTKITLETFTKILEASQNKILMINLQGTEISNEYLQVIGENCPKLITLNITGRTHKGIKNAYRRLFDSQITDHGLEHLTQLKTLKHLSLSKCHKITNAGLEHLSTLTNLEYLDISKCEGIGDSGLASLTSLTKLQYIDLSKCKKIRGNGLSWLPHSVTWLSLYDCEKITDKDLEVLTLLTNLQYLNLCFCTKVTNAALATITKNHKKLKHLGLFGCTKITDAGLTSINLMRPLETLDLGGCNAISDNLFSTLNLAHLKTLNLCFCKKITGESANIPTFPKLEGLNLTGCPQVTNEGLQSLNSLTHLKYLLLWNCDEVTDEGLNHLKQLPNLQTIGLWKCHSISMDGLRRLTDFKNLEYVDICDCFKFGKKDAFYYLKNADKKVIHTLSCSLDALQTIGPKTLVGFALGTAAAATILATGGTATPAIALAYLCFAGSFFPLYNIASTEWDQKIETTAIINRETNLLKTAYGNSIYPTAPLLHFLPSCIVMEQEIKNIPQTTNNPPRGRRRAHRS